MAPNDAAKNIPERHIGADVRRRENQTGDRRQIRPAVAVQHVDDGAVLRVLERRRVVIVMGMHMPGAGQTGMQQQRREPKAMAFFAADTQ